MENVKDQLIRQIDHPDEEFVGPYRKTGDNEIHIESLAWAAGLRITPEGYAVPQE